MPLVDCQEAVSDFVDFSGCTGERRGLSPRCTSTVGLTPRRSPLIDNSRRTDYRAMDRSPHPAGVPPENSPPIYLLSLCPSSVVAIELRSSTFDANNEDCHVPAAPQVVEARPGNCAPATNRPSPVDSSKPGDPREP